MRLVLGFTKKMFEENICRESSGENLFEENIGRETSGENMFEKLLAEKFLEKKSHLQRNFWRKNSKKVFAENLREKKT